MDDLQYVCIYTGLTMREGYCTTFYKKLLAVISHDNYYISFITLIVIWYSNTLLPLIMQFLLFPNRIGGFMDLRL